MAKNITLYIDDETEKLLSKKGKVNYSKLFQKALKHYLLRSKELNKELDKLPSADDIEEQFKFLPSVHEIEMLNEELEKLPDEDMLNDMFRSLPTAEQIEELDEALNKLPSSDDIEDMFKGMWTVQDVQELNEELNETIEKLERIKEIQEDTK